MVHALVAGGDCIHAMELLRAGSTASVLGHRVMAASAVGTWLRSFTFGYVRQLDRLTETILSRARAAGVGPADGPLLVDVDSTIYEVRDYHKHGACYGYTHRLGYHPLLATRADTGEVLHARLRQGSANTARGIVRFVDELVARLRLAGAVVELTFRTDSGFWSTKLLRRLRQHRVRCSVTVRQTTTVRAVIAAIPEGDRLIVRRVRNLGDQQQLLPTWRSHVLVTNRVGTATWLDADHRRHAVCELAIRDLKAGAGLAHLPSGHFNANAAWLLAATLAHDLLCWTATLGLGAHDQQLGTKAIRRTLLVLPGRLTAPGRRAARRGAPSPARSWPASSRFGCGRWPSRKPRPCSQQETAGDRAGAVAGRPGPVPRPAAGGGGGRRRGRGHSSPPATPESPHPTPWRDACAGVNS